MRKLTCGFLLVFFAFAAMWSAPVRAQDYPYQSHPVTLDGTVSAVDTDRDRVILTSDDGHSYTLDTSMTDITLLDGNRAGLTNDLLKGMRVHVVGKALSQTIVEADQLRVISLTSPRPISPTPPLAAPGAPITLRGTVISTDSTQGSFVVDITLPTDHKRTIFVSDQTDMSGLGRGTQNPLPVRVGDRVSVAGLLLGNGTVQADAVSLGRTLPAGAVAYRSNHEITGRVTVTSNRFTSRDLKVQVGSNHEITVHVPSHTPVRRSGQPISVHEINKDDQVRVIGSYEGDDFKATRIDDFPLGEGF